jgi:uncharacterized protein YndB with AHSA1/START domain
MSKGETVEEIAVVFRRALAASPEKVWDFLTDPQRLPQWHGEGVIEPREGGKVDLMSGHIRGVVTGWRPGRFLAYTWNVFAPGETESAWPVSYLEFALAPEKGGTALTLTHRPIPKAMSPQTMMGWHTFLEMLAAGLDGGAVEARESLMRKNAPLYGVDFDNLRR